MPFIPNIKNSVEKVNELLDNKISISSFGDGEFNLINGNDILFQTASPKLSKRLKDILTSNDKNISIGINYYFWNYRKNPFNIVENFHNTWVSNNLSKITSLLSPNKTYYNSTFTAPFCTFKDYNFKEYYEKVKDIWRGRDITIICGKTVFDKISTSIFDCANSINFICSDSKNAFDNYDNLLKEAKKINRNRIVAIILGPTTTVLAYDMAKLGYKALDIGHIVKDYDWYLQKIQHNDKTLKDFFNPD